MQISIALIVTITVCSMLACVQCSCDYNKQGKQLVSVVNSVYSILDDGTLCCPFHKSQSACRSEEEMDEICSYGLVNEPCSHCKTCAKTLGDKCGGPYGTVGRCGNQWVCTVDESEFLDGGNKTGVCSVKTTKELHQECGGPFGIKGRCKKAFECSASEKEFLSGSNITGVCRKRVCSKNCSKRAMSQVCGSDGHFYDNICYLRQVNCLNPPGVLVTKVDLTQCKKAVPTESTTKDMYSGQKSISAEEEINNGAA